MAHLHAGFLAEESDVRIVAACDHGSGRASDFSRNWGAAAYSDSKRMLDEQEVDAVYICTPTSTHAAIGLECAERNLAIFLEKPLDLDLRAGYRLCRAVEARGLLAMMAFQWRYSPGFLRAAELVGSEPIALVAMRWYWTRPPVRWMWNRSEAGGQVVDQSIHLIDVGQALAGPVDRIYAAYNQHQVNFDEGFENWDGYALTLHFAGGAVGSCAGTYATFSSIQERPSVDFCLRDRVVRVTDLGVLHLTPDGVEEWTNDEPLHLGVNRAFLSALRSGKASAVATPLREGLRTTAVTLAANRSAQTGRPVTMREFLDEFAESEEVGP